MIYRVCFVVCLLSATFVLGAIYLGVGTGPLVWPVTTIGFLATLPLAYVFFDKDPILKQNALLGFVACAVLIAIAELGLAAF